MSYSQFKNLEQAIEAFEVTVVESVFLPAIETVVPSEMLVIFLGRSVPIVSAASEKSRSEGIIYPVLLEVRDLLKDQVSLFSGRDFNVDAKVGLNGIVDFFNLSMTSGRSKTIADRVGAQFACGGVGGSEEGGY